MFPGIAYLFVLVVLTQPVIKSRHLLLILIVLLLILVVLLLELFLCFFLQGDRQVFCLTVTDDGVFQFVADLVRRDDRRQIVYGRDLVIVYCKDNISCLEAGCFRHLGVNGIDIDRSAGLAAEQERWQPY